MTNPEDPNYWSGNGSIAVTKPTQKISPDDPGYWDPNYLHGNPNTAGAIPNTTPKSYDAMQVPGAAYEHLGKSGGQFLSGVGNMFIHPIDTVTGMGGAIGGAGALLGERIANGGAALTPAQQTSIAADHPFMQSMIDKANSIGGLYKARYNGYDAIKRTMAEDPVGFAADLATILSAGAGAARAVGVDAAGATRAASAEAAMAGRGVPGPMAWAASQVANPLRTVGVVNPGTYTNALGGLAAKVTRYGINALTPQRGVVRGATEGMDAPMMAKLQEAIDNPIVNGSVPSASVALGPNPMVRAAWPGVAPPGAAPHNYPPRTSTYNPPMSAGDVAPNPDSLALGVSPSTLLGTPTGQEVETMGSLKVANPTNALVPSSPSAIEVVPDGLPGNGYSIDPRLALAPGSAQAPHTVPSVNPSVTNAMIPTGSPGIIATKIAAMGAQARRNHPTEFARIDEANNTARTSLIDRTGQVPGAVGKPDISSAVADNKTLMRQEYAPADAKLSSGDAQLHNIVTRSLSGTVMQRARDLLGESRTPFQVGAYVPAHIAADGTHVAAVYPRYSGRALQAIKQAFDDLSFDPTVRGAGDISEAGARAIQGTRAEFLAWVGQSSKNPELISAMHNSASRFNQIDRMKLGQHLNDILHKELTDGYTIDHRADAYANAIKPSNQAQTLFDATGHHRYENFNELATPNELAAFDAVKADHAREAIDRGYASRGGKFKSNLDTSASDGSDVNTPHVPGIGGNVLNFLKNMLTGGADARVSARLGPEMQTAPGLLRIIKNADAQEKLFNSIGSKTRRIGNALNIPFVYPSIPSIVQQQRDDQQKKNALNKRGN